MSTEIPVKENPVRRVSIARSRQELASRQTQNLRQETLYNPSHKWIVQSYDSVDYFFPPDLDGSSVTHPQTGKVVVADGLLVVSDRYGIWRDNLTQQLRGPSLLPGGSAFEIASFMVEKLSNRGVFLLVKDGMDDERKLISKSELKKYNHALATELVKARAAYTVKWAQENPGTRVPPATKDQKWAQRYLDEIADQGEEIRGKYSCKFECMDTNDFKEFARHMRVAHNEIVEDPTKNDPVNALVNPVIEPPKSSVKPIQKRD